MHQDAALLFNTIPIPMFLVDRNMVVRKMNDAAIKWVDLKEVRYSRRLGGEILKCLNAHEPGGCGKGPHCRNCVIRNAVLDCPEGGVLRKKAMLQRGSAIGEVIELLITTSSYDAETFLLIVEDITQLSSFQDLVPICMDCRKVRDDEEYWQNLESFLSRNAGIDLTHGLCPSCFEKRTREYKQG
ncbi:nitrogen regulation protein NR(II) [Geomesophilobacter sediminis]|uniref:PAS domain-containing protein n=1 Tax=Geomesophilobacter sediminis TaxID=2798584 RepID=A0A8J7SAM4_9BACT|nr:hypothetical protein [Geomesophilobacter sediminis]MBJ6727386.1 hypothetical protein [Geomesophilobacter sediminis]